MAWVPSERFCLRCKSLFKLIPIVFAQMAVTISPEFVWKERVHGASERWHIWVEVEIFLEPEHLLRLSTAFPCSIIRSISTSSFVDFDVFNVCFLSLV
jgi:hypothetical protein